MKTFKLFLAVIVLLSGISTVFAQSDESNLNLDPEKYVSDLENDMYEETNKKDETDVKEENNINRQKYGEDINTDTEKKDNTNMEKQKDEKELNSVSLGLLNGGSLVGIEYERLLFNRFGIIAGGGLLGFNGGFNIHLKKDIHSHYLHFGAVNMGTLSYYFRYAELSTNFRIFQLVELSIGLAYTLGYSDDYEEYYKDNFDMDIPDYMLTYSIGLYTTF